MRFLKKLGKILVLTVLCLILVAGFSTVYKDYKKREAEVKRELALPKLPIGYEKRASILGKGDVIVLINNYSSDLFVEAIFKNEKKQKTITILMKPRVRYPIGWAEGWRLKKGDALKVSSKGFQSAYYHHKENLEKIDPALVCGIATLSGLSPLCSLIEH